MKLESNIRITHTWSLCSRFECRSRKSLWGRFGGGWNWKLGIQAGGTTIIFSMLICEVTFYLQSREAQIARRAFFDKRES